MDIVKYTIVFDQPNKIYYTGQMLTGRVNLVTSSAKIIKSVLLKIKGKAVCQWFKKANYHTGRRLPIRKVTYKGKEVYLESELILCGGVEERFELPAGEHSYTFAMRIPNEMPSSFSGTYGHVVYYAKTKINLPIGFDKGIKQTFTVMNLFNLNHFPELEKPYKSVVKEAFWFWCCTTGPLTITINLPKTGFAKSEAIPIMVDADNNSDVSVPSVDVYLKRVVIWQAGEHRKHEYIQLQHLMIGSLEERQSQLWKGMIEIPQALVPSSEDFHIINVGYELHIKAEVSGMHSDLHARIPLTIGDIPFGEDAQGFINDSSQPDYEPNNSETSSSCGMAPMNCTSIPFPYSQGITENATNNLPLQDDLVSLSESRA